MQLAYAHLWISDAKAFCGLEQCKVVARIPKTHLGTLLLDAVADRSCDFSKGISECEQAHQDE